MPVIVTRVVDRKLIWPLRSPSSFKKSQESGKLLENNECGTINSGLAARVARIALQFLGYNLSSTCRKVFICTAS